MLSGESGCGQRSRLRLPALLDELELRTPPERTPPDELPIDPRLDERPMLLGAELLLGPKEPPERLGERETDGAREGAGERPIEEPRLGIEGALERELEYPPLLDDGARERDGAVNPPELPEDDRDELTRGGADRVPELRRTLDELLGEPVFTRDPMRGANVPELPRLTPVRGEEEFVRVVPEGTRELVRGAIEGRPEDRSTPCGRMVRNVRSPGFWLLGVERTVAPPLPLVRLLENVRHRERLVGSLELVELVGRDAPVVGKPSRERRGVSPNRRHAGREALPVPDCVVAPDLTPPAAPGAATMAVAFPPRDRAVALGEAATPLERRVSVVELRTDVDEPV